MTPDPPPAVPPAAGGRVRRTHHRHAHGHVITVEHPELPFQENPMKTTDPDTPTATLP